MRLMREEVPLTERQMQDMASAWPRYMQVRICICRRTVSSGKHTDDASRPEAAPSPKLCTVSVLQHPDDISAIDLRGLHGMSVHPERLHRPDTPWHSDSGEACGVLHDGCRMLLARHGFVSTMPSRQPHTHFAGDNH